MDSFEEHYARASPRLAAFCRLLTGNETEAAELFQDTWAQALTRAAQSRGVPSFNAWLVAIARNLWVDRLRRRGAERRALEARGLPPEAVDPASSDLQEALGRLPAEEREAVLLYHLQGFSLREAAAVAGTTPWVIRERLGRAHQALRRLL